MQPLILLMFISDVKYTTNYAHQFNILEVLGETLFNWIEAKNEMLREEPFSSSSSCIVN